MAVGVALLPEAGAVRAAEPSPATKRMAERLAQLIPDGDAGLNPTSGWAFRLAKFRAERDQATDFRKRMNLSVRLGRNLLFAGETQQAIDQILGIRDSLESMESGPDAGSFRGLSQMLSTAYLRLAEEQNCLARHGPDSCLLPLRGGGVHIHKRGAQLAIGELTAFLQKYPNDIATTWLLNIGYMALGEHPSQVPKNFLIPPAAYASDYDIGRFSNVATKLGIDVCGLAGGSVVEDLDGDGFLDIMASGWGIDEQIRYFRNNGDGTFTERTEEAGLMGEVGGLNICHADYNNDGHADVLILRGGWMARDGRHPNSLLRNNGDGTFSDVTEEAGLLSFHPTQTAAWGDYDNDGFVDLFIGNESSRGQRSPCELYRNNGDGTFTDIAKQAGVAHVGFVKGVAFGDYDNDGRIDLYLSRQGQPNLLYHNDGPRKGTWRFTELGAQAGVTEPVYSFPTWFWDFDNDGWLDIFVAPFPGFYGDSLSEIVADYLGKTSLAERARLYRNNGDGTFTDVAKQVGLDDVMLAMGANYGDLDNDGFLDLYVGTGDPALRTLVPN